MKLAMAFFCALLLPLTAGGQGSELPRLGDASSGIVSLSQERKLGQQFLRSIRASGAALADPLLQDYLEHLIYRLAASSELQDKRLDLVIINDPQLNAFAAPGGIVGVNHGLFFHARTEQEISAILAHELAHLSQRHYARQLAGNKGAKAVSIAGLLAGLALMATAGTDAGLATIATAQGYGQHQLLKYSREREAEADRIGINTLAAAGMDPEAMAYMFERLQESARFSTGQGAPEFLRTHPVTRKRVSDAYNQSRQHPQQVYPLSLDYQLMRTRARALTASSADLAREFEAGLEDDDPVRRTANRYGLALALTLDLDFDGALFQLAGLREESPQSIAFLVAEAEALLLAGRVQKALALLDYGLAFSPENYPLAVKQAEAYIQAGRPRDAIGALTPVSNARPSDPFLWYLLAEAYGLGNDIPRLHEARAEYFVLNGAFEQAEAQLGYALPLVEDSFAQTARIKQRIEEIERMRKQRR